MEYLAKIVSYDDGWNVSFPDKENVNTFGESLEDAIKMAEEALNETLEVEFDLGFDIVPVGRHRGKDLYPITVRPHIVVAYRLKELRAARTQVEFARLIGTSQQDYQRLEKSRSNPTIKTLEKIAKANGKRLVVNFV